MSKVDPQSPSPSSTPSHTPGPWHTGGLIRHGNEVVLNVWGPTPPGAQSGHQVATYCRPADARLIAAAPELLEALKELGDWIAAGLRASDDAIPDAECLRETERLGAKARAAVDKAEGRRKPVRGFLGSTPWGEIDDSP